MSKEKLYIFDTTLRDGAQTEGVDFSVEDKNKIAKVLSEIGIDYIEGGWPGANPVDTEFFSKPLNLNKSIFTAFGMTKKTGRSAENDPSLSSLINASCSAICIVGKAWDFHVKTALEIKNEDNLEHSVNELSFSFLILISNLSVKDFFKANVGMIDIKLALPHLSPKPFIVPCTCLTPA